MNGMLYKRLLIDSGGCQLLRAYHKNIKIRGGIKLMVRILRVDICHYNNLLLYRKCLNTNESYKHGKEA